jgi:hypothetical protein
MPSSGTVPYRSYFAEPTRSFNTRLAAFLTLLLSVPFFIKRALLLLSPLPLQDFMTYWAAGRLFLTGANPYSMSATVAIDRSLGWTNEQQFVMLNPPWSLPFVAPLAMMPFHVAHYVSLSISLALELICCLAFWRYFGGERRQQWIAVAVLATFLPAAAAEHYGQITPLIFAGVTGFFFALRHRRYVLASACLLIFGLKPHLLYLVLFAILLWAIQHRKWAIPITGCVLAALASLGSIAFNRNVLGFFHGTFDAAVQTDCGAGGFLRVLFGRQHLWLQFVPSAAGIVWFAWYWWRYHRRWVWEERLPLLLLVSIGTSPYFWWHDLAVGLPSILALAVQVARSRQLPSATFLYLGIQVFIGLFGVNSESSAASLLWIVLYVLIQFTRAPRISGRLVPEAA